MLKRFDDGLARGEATLAGFLLLSMVAVAAVQVVIDNSAVRFAAEWAQEAKTHLGWIDDYLERITVVLAFLGASLAVRAQKHILIDALVRVLPERVRQFLKGLSLVIAAVVCHLLARVFYQAAIGASVNDAREQSLETYLLDGTHVCDASASALAEVELSQPTMFCAFRSFTHALGVGRLDTRGSEEVWVPAIDVADSILRYAVPVMLMVISVRFLAYGIVAFRDFARGVGEGTHAPRKSAGEEAR